MNTDQRRALRNVRRVPYAESVVTESPSEEIPRSCPARTQNNRRMRARAASQCCRIPTLNKGTAFTEKEREALGLRGLLPPHVTSQDEQATRVLVNLRKLSDPLEKFVALNALHDRNEALFFRVLCDNIDEMQPLVYTPTVGLACQKFGLIFQRPRGIFIGANDRGRVAEVLRNWPYPAQADRRHRRRAHTRARRSRRQRHGHSGRQAVALHRLRRHPSAGCACRSRSTSAPTTKRCSGTCFTSGCASIASPARPTTN